MMNYTIKLLLLCSVALLLGGLAYGRVQEPNIPTGTLWLRPHNYSKVWQRLRTSTRDARPFRVLHIGDSHIKYGFVTAPIKQALQSKYGEGIQVEHWGINGATFAAYGVEEEIQRIVEAKPALLIVSLGTNDSYTPRFSAEEMRGNMQAFFSLLKKNLPHLPIVLTTPPASYLVSSKRVSAYAGRGKARRRTYQSSTSYTYNKHTQTAVNTMKYMAQMEGYGLIDVYASMGGEQGAEQWLRDGLMHTDRVHYTSVGYTKHGETIAAVLIDVIEGKIK